MGFRGFRGFGNYVEEFTPFRQAVGAHQICRPATVVEKI